MLDHVFTDAIGALRQNLEDARLEPQTLEELFVSDVLLGDVTWQTAYGLPGEGSPPQVQADITLEWPTWAQSTYRSWCLGEGLSDSPRIQIEIVLRVQRLRHMPNRGDVLRVLPAESSPIGRHHLDRAGVRVEIGYEDDLDDAPEYAIEVSYEGTYELDEETLENADLLDAQFSAMGGWISSTLVRLGDLSLEFLPAEEDRD